MWNLESLSKEEQEILNQGLAESRDIDRVLKDIPDDFKKEKSIIVIFRKVISELGRELTGREMEIIEYRYNHKIL